MTRSEIGQCGGGVDCRGRSRASPRRVLEDGPVAGRSGWHLRRCGSRWSGWASPTRRSASSARSSGSPGRPSTGNVSPDGEGRPDGARVLARR